MLSDMKQNKNPPTQAFALFWVDAWIPIFAMMNGVKMIPSTLKVPAV